METQPREDDVLMACLQYRGNGDDSRFTSVFERLPHTRIIQGELGRIWEHQVFLSIYPLSEKYANECMFMYHQNRAEDNTTNNASYITTEVPSNYFAFYLHPTGEMIGVARMTSPKVIVESSRLVFTNPVSRFVYLLPSTTLFPDRDFFHQLITDARISVSIL